MALALYCKTNISFLMLREELWFFFLVIYSFTVSVIQLYQCHSFGYRTFNPDPYKSVSYLYRKHWSQPCRVAYGVTLCFWPARWTIGHTQLYWAGIALVSLLSYSNTSTGPDYELKSNMAHKALLDSTHAETQMGWHVRSHLIISSMWPSMWTYQLVQSQKPSHRGQHYWCHSPVYYMWTLL